MSKYYTHDNNCNYTDERFLKLSKKINSIQNFELKNPNKLSNIEAKMDFLEVSILRTIKDFEFKSKFLQDEMDLLTKMLEEEKSSKEELKKRINLELKNFEAKVKTAFENEREVIKEFTESLIKTLEEEISNIHHEISKEKEEIVASLQSLKSFVQIDLTKFNETVDSNSQRRKDQIKFLVQTMVDELKYLNDLV
jgi:hypothetical protein